METLCSHKCHLELIAHGVLFLGGLEAHLGRRVELSCTWGIDVVGVDHHRVDNTVAQYVLRGISLSCCFA